MFEAILQVGKNLLMH